MRSLHRIVWMLSSSAVSIFEKISGLVFIFQLKICHTIVVSRGFPLDECNRRLRPSLAGTVRRAVRFLARQRLRRGRSGAPQRCAPTTRTLVRRPWPVGTARRAVRFLSPDRACGAQSRAPRRCAPTNQYARASSVAGGDGVPSRPSLDRAEALAAPKSRATHGMSVNRKYFTINLDMSVKFTFIC